jgi:hypothetical protein
MMERIAYSAWLLASLVQVERIVSAVCSIIAIKLIISIKCALVNVPLRHFQIIALLLVEAAFILVKPAILKINVCHV